MHIVVPRECRQREHQEHEPREREVRHFATAAGRRVGQAKRLGRDEPGQHAAEAELRTSRKTIYVHRTNVWAKLGIGSDLELVNLARRRGVVTVN
jgi:hypothetical protein